MNNHSDDCLFKQVEKLEIEAKKFGFYWETVDQLIDQIKSECDEIEEAWENKNRAHLKEEVGDLIQAAISLAIFCQVDPKEALSESINKFIKRYDAVVTLAKKDGHETLHNQSFDVLMHYWKQAKKLNS